jgi:hypothetical protein
MDQVAQMVEVLNGLTARDALCLLVGCMLTALDEAPSEEERQQSLDNCIELLKGVPVARRTKDRLPTGLYCARDLIVFHQS